LQQSIDEALKNNAQVKIANYDINLQQALKKGSVTIPKTEFSYTQGVVSNPTITDNLLNVGQRIDFQPCTVTTQNWHKRKLGVAKHIKL
jgi:cobalt-zinc-cadmium resistance protein CzcA